MTISLDSTDKQTRENAAAVLSERLRDYCGYEPQYSWRSDRLEICVSCLDTLFSESLLFAPGRFLTMETYSYPEIAAGAPAVIDKTEEMKKEGVRLYDDSGQPIDWPTLSFKGSDGAEMRQSAVFMVALADDTAALAALYRLPQISGLFPEDLRFMWHKITYHSAVAYEYIAVKQIPRPITNSMISTARREASDYGDNYVSFKLKPEYHELWTKMTTDNIGKSLAMILDDAVISYPVVQSEITGGNSSVSGILWDDLHAFVSIISHEPLPCRITSVACRLAPCVGKH